MTMVAKNEEHQIAVDKPMIDAQPKVVIAGSHTITLDE